MNRTIPSWRAWTAASRAPPGRLPLILVDQVVQLDQVDVVRAQPLERLLDLRVRGVASALAGLRGQEDLVAVVLEPRREPELRIAVAGGRVDVIDPVAGDQLEGRIGLLLGDRAEGRGPEDDPRALVAGAAKGKKRDHGA